jgi:small-conductance mechanosensitive channel
MLVVMVEKVSIAGLRARKAAREARILAMVQSVVIFLLLVVVAEEYDHNESLQAWAGTHLGGLGFLLNGTLAAFYAGVLIVVHLNRPVPVVTSRVRRREEIAVAPDPVK